MAGRNETRRHGEPDGRVAVVVATRNRRESLARTLTHLAGLPEQPHVVVVDNGSNDGTADAARAAGVEVVELGRNTGPSARTVGARRVAAPYVAFSDDDSWWAPGALARAADALDAHERLALVAARVLVGDEERVDPVSEAMRRSPLRARVPLPGPPVLGFVACGAVVRRSAFLNAGGFDEDLATGAEETLLALELASRGWGLAYVDDVVAHHHPSVRRDPRARRRAELRNVLIVSWLRRPLSRALRETGTALLASARDGEARRGLLEVARRAPRLARERRVASAELEAELRALGL